MRIPDSFMKHKTGWLALLLMALIAGGLHLKAEQWLMFGADPQRDGWARGENILTPENVKSMKLQWKLRLQNTPKELNSLTAPIVVENVLTAQGHKDIVVIAGASDTLDAVDADTGKLLWHKRFEVQGTPRQRSRWLCPNALNATPVIQQGGESPRDKTVQVVS